MQSFFADIKLEVGQIKKKVQEKFIKPLFIEKSIIFKKRNDHKLSIKKLNALAWSCLISELVGPITPELWFDMFCSLLFKKVFFLKKKRPADYNPIFLDCNSPRISQN